jgi:ribosomal-protein-alanine N-acetyltransferase
LKLPTFETKRLVLREVTLEDAPAYQRNFADYEVVRFLSHRVPWPYPENGVAEFLRDLVLPHLGRDRWLWGICLKENPGEVIGAVDLWREGRPEHRGFWLAKRFWGRGFMAEAVVPVMDYAFSDLGFGKIVLSNALGNTQSRRIKEKTGARYVGLRDFQFVDPSFTQSELWEITKEEWKKFRRGSSG